MSATKRGMVAAVLGLTMLAAAACDSATAGQPEPGQKSSETTEESTAESTSEGAEPDSDYSLASLCGLLTPEEAQQLGGSAAGEQGNSIGDGHAICTWKDQTSLVVGYQTGTSTAEADTGPGITNTPTTIDGLPAVQSLSTDTVVICEILVDLPSGKMVAASATVLSAGEGKYDQCQVANQLANLIIPRVKDQ